MENVNFIENGNEDTENILTISENQINYYSFTRINDNLEAINYKINLLKEIYENILIKLIDKSIKDKIVSNFNQIYSLLNLISKEKKNILSQYEFMLKMNEEKIRKLYSDIFYLKIRNTYLENNVEILLQKENEYKLIKEKTGILIENGEVVYNDRKDNEIFILRQENSNLKTVVNKNENELNEFKKKYEKDKFNFQEKINKLTLKISLLKNRLLQHESGTKIRSASNIKLAISNEINKNNYKNKNKIIKKATSLRKDTRKISLNHCQSNGFLDLKLDFKNIIASKLNSYNNQSKSRVPSLKLSNINKVVTYNKKLLYLTPRNQINEIKITNYQKFQNKVGVRKKNKNIKNKTEGNNTLSNDSNKKNTNYTFNQKIHKDKPKNQKIKSGNLSTKNIKIKSQLTWTQNFQINEPLIPSSPLKINKIYVLNHNIKKMDKDQYIPSDVKTDRLIKRKRNISNKVADKSCDFFHQLNLSSIIRKNMSKHQINNCKTNHFISANANK